jgi:hypothetical protein
MVRQVGEALLLSDLWIRFFFLPQQLQHLVSDEICIQVKDLFSKESKRRATGGNTATAHRRHAKELSYQRKAEQIMTDENCFKIVFVCVFLLSINILFINCIGFAAQG